MTRFASVCAALSALCVAVVPLRPVYSQSTSTRPLWTARFDGVGHGNDSASKVATDPAGNVYVAGIVSNGKNNDYETIKYSPTGVKIWARRFNAISNQDDFLRDMVVDKAGNVYVTGSSYSNITNYDIKTIKYDASGHEAWSVRFVEGYSLKDSAYATRIILDKDGNVLIGGGSPATDPATGHYWPTFTVVKYNGETGVMLWSRQENFGSDTFTYLNALTTDAAGSVFAAGGWADDSDIGIVKYSVDGVRLWIVADRRYSYDSADSTTALPDGSGGVYVNFSLGYADGTNYYTAHYSSTGTRLWEQSYASPSEYYASRSTPIGMVKDSKGNLYVTGSAIIGRTQHTYGDDDYATLKYAPDGTLLWARLYNGSGTVRSEDDATSIAVNLKDEIIVSGTSTNAGQTVWATLTYNAAGTLLSTRRYRVAPSSYPTAVTLDGLDNVLVTGNYRPLNANSYAVGDFLTLKYAP